MRENLSRDLRDGERRLFAYPQDTVGAKKWAVNVKIPNKKPIEIFSMPSIRSIQSVKNEILMSRSRPWMLPKEVTYRFRCPWCLRFGPTSRQRRVGRRFREVSNPYYFFGGLGTGVTPTCSTLV